MIPATKEPYGPTYTPCLTAPEKVIRDETFRRSSLPTLLGSPCQTQTEGKRRGPIEGEKLNALPDQFPGDAPFRRVHPGATAPCREGSLRGVEGDFQHRIGRENLGEPEQHPSSADIATHSLERRPTLPLGPTRDWQFEWEADAGLPPLPLDVNQSPESLHLGRRDLEEANTMERARHCNPRYPCPDDLRLRLDRRFGRLEGELEGGAGREALGEFEAGSPPH